MVALAHLADVRERAWVDLARRAVVVRVAEAEALGGLAGALALALAALGLRGAIAVTTVLQCGHEKGKPSEPLVQKFHTSSPNRKSTYWSQRARVHVDKTPFWGNFILRNMKALRITRKRARRHSESRGIAIPKGLVTILNEQVSPSISILFSLEFLIAWRLAWAKLVTSVRRSASQRDSRCWILSSK